MAFTMEAAAPGADADADDAVTAKDKIPLFPIITSC